MAARITVACLVALAMARDGEWGITYAAGPAEADGRGPNILFILADDIGVEAIGAYGGTSYATPRIDHLAAGGRTYRHAYSQPLCSPSRAQLLTGQYNFRNYDAFGYLDQRHTTLAQVLRGAGYATAIAGKWQLSRPCSRIPLPPPTGPIAPNVTPAVMRDGYGFDAYSLWQLNGSNQGSRYWQPRIEQNGTVLPVAPDTYGPDVHVAFLDDFITRHRDEPFFAWYSMTLPHDPWAATPASPEGTRSGSDPALFSDNVSYLDTLVGRLVDRLDELGIADNTVVVFTSDNGTRAEITSETTSGPIQGGKGTMTDAGTHVPLIASWPDHISPGRSSAQLVDFTDFLPTIARLAQAALPANLTIDGHAFLAADGSEVDDGRELVYSHYREDGRAQRQGDLNSARDQRYKLYSNGRFFDLQSTPLEEPGDSIPLGEGTPEAQSARETLLAELRSKNDLLHRERPAQAVLMVDTTGTVADDDRNHFGDWATTKVILAGDNDKNTFELRSVFHFKIGRSITQQALGAAASIHFAVQVASVVGSPVPMRLVAMRSSEDGIVFLDDFNALAGETLAVFENVSVGDILTADVTAYVLDDLKQSWTSFRIEPLNPAGVPDGPEDPSGNSADYVAFGVAVGGNTDALADARLVINAGLPGDLNFDGFVGQSDLDIVLANWETRRPPGDFRRGEADGSGFVSQADLAIVLDAWSTGSAPTLSSLGLASVPDPATATLLLGSGAVLAGRRRRSSGPTRTAQRLNEAACHD